MGSSSLNSSVLSIATATVAPTPFALGVPAGLVPGTTGVSQSGFNASIDATPEDVWNVGGQLIYLTSAETLEVASSDAVDTSAGTGAQTIQISGLDSNFDEISETIIMNGLTDVTSVNSYLRLDQMTTITAGSTGANQGDITATATTAATIQGQIDAESNGSLTFNFTVPNAKTAFVTALNFTAGSVDEVSFGFFVRTEGGVFVQQNLHQVIGDAFNFSLNPYSAVPARADIRVLAFQISGGGSIAASALMQLYLVDD